MAQFSLVVSTKYENDLPYGTFEKPDHAVRALRVSFPETKIDQVKEAEIFIIDRGVIKKYATIDLDTMHQILFE